MKIDGFLKAALLGVGVMATVPASAPAQSLKVLRGDASSTLGVPINRAVVVESEVPFAELSIANPGIADISTLSDRTIYVLGRAPGRTTLTLLGAEGQLIANIEVAVTPDISEFKERLQQILPGENIEVRTANDGIVLSGTVSSIVKLDRALDLANRYAPERVSNLMSVGGTQQVQLKVRFLEMQRSVSKGLNASLYGGSGDDAFALGPQSQLGIRNPDSGGAGVITPLAALSTRALGRAVLGDIGLGGVNANIVIEALESKGLVRTLSEPNLVALSGQEASFLAGGEYPIPVVGEEGVSIEYRPFGVQLSFTPRVVEGDVINLELNASVSSLDPASGITQNGFTVDAFRKRETRTTVEMRDGESFAIAGLLQDDFEDNVDQVPWLGDIPVLGALFRSSSYRRDQSELVVLVTPHLVSPVRGDALTMATDRVLPPSEANLFLNGKTAAAPQSGPAAEVARQDFTGSFGYTME